MQINSSFIDFVCYLSEKIEGHTFSVLPEAKELNQLFDQNTIHYRLSRQVMVDIYKTHQCQNIWQKIEPFNLDKSVKTRKSMQALDAPSKIKKNLITNKVTATFLISLCTSIAYMSFPRLTDLSRFKILDVLGETRGGLLNKNGDIDQINLIDKIGELTVEYYQLPANKQALSEQRTAKVIPYPSTLFRPN